MTAVEAQPFFQMVDWLEGSPSPPGIVVVENVAGMTKTCRARSAGQRPIDFVLHGEVPLAYTSGMRKVGLADMDRYWTAPVFQLTAAECGLPLVRSRIFIVMLRKDLYTMDDVRKVEKNLADLKRQTLRPEPTESFLATDESGNEVPHKKQRTTLNFQNRKADEFRRAHGLPPRTARNGQPFTMNMDPSQWSMLSNEQRERCDVAYLLAQKRDPEFNAQKLAIDATQSLNREQWKLDGRIPSLGTHSKITYGGRVLGHRTLFNMMGWMRGSYELPEGLSGNVIQRLLGNMLCPPVIGSVCAAVLAVDARFAPAKEDTIG